MGKVNNLFDITHRSLIKEKERKTVSEHCLEDPPALDTDYLAKLKKLNQKKTVPTDDVLVIAMVNEHYKLPPDESVRFANRIPEMIVKKTLAIASKKDKFDKQALAVIEKPKLANNFSPTPVVIDKSRQLQTAKINTLKTLPFAQPVISGHHTTEMIFKNNDPLLTMDKCCDTAHLEKAKLKTKVTTNTEFEQSNRLSETQQLDHKTHGLPAWQPNLCAQQHVESTVAAGRPDKEADRLPVKDAEKKNSETQTLPSSLTITTTSFYGQNNVLPAPVNEHKTQDKKMPSTLHRSMTDIDNAFQTPKISFSSKEGGMRYHFNKWQGYHSVNIQFDKVDDHHIYLSPSNLIVEKQLSEHLNQLPTKFKVQMSDKNELYRSKQFKDEAFDEKDEE